MEEKEEKYCKAILILSKIDNVLQWDWTEWFNNCLVIRILLLFYCELNCWVFSGTGSYEFILTEKKGAKQNVGLITLNRPKALNALCDKLVAELSDAVATFDNDDSVGALIITGSEKAFAAGKFYIYLN